jgi:protein involved in polysaccharide export with SLBB domain
MRSTRTIFTTGALVFALTATAAHAQSNSSGSGSGQGNMPEISNDTTPRAQTDIYLLGPQDVINITVEGFPNYSATNVVVPPDGKIALPYFGTLQVNNLTANQVERLATQRINKRIRNPKVTVSLQRLRTAAWGVVHIIGTVRLPGTVEILKGYRLTEVLSKVGGVVGRIDAMQASLARTGQPTKQLNLHEAVSRPLSAANIRVQPNDFITIQEPSPGRIAVNGDVARPGVFEMYRSPRPAQYELSLKPRLNDAIIAAGGVSGGQGSSVITGFLQRGMKKIDLRVQDALESKDPTANIILQPGDFLTVRVVPPMNVYVQGYAKSPGRISVRQGIGVLEAIAQAGGLTRSIEKVNATVQRGATTIDLDLARILSGDSRANLTLQAEDVINLREPEIIRIDIAGRVGQPSGSEGLRMPPNSTILNALSWAGGLATRPEQTRITILRRTEAGDQKFLTVDPVALMDMRDPSQNARLQDGDLINVSEIKRQNIVISGEVMRQGPIEIEEGQTMAEVLAAAGGPTPRALLDQIKLQRNGQTQVIKAYDAVKFGTPLDVKLQDGDFITVPQNQKRVMVMEAVNAPGEIPFPERESLTILRAISAAGGTRIDAKPQEIALLRQVAPNKVERTVISLKNLGTGDNIGAANTELRPGDLIVVPQTRVTPSLLQRAGQIFGTLGVVRSIAGF